MAYIPLPRDNTHADYIWEPRFLHEIDARIRSLPLLTGEELADCLGDAHRRALYYHSELVEFLEAAVKEAQKRLRLRP